MKDLLDFFSVHWFLAWCALWLAWAPVYLLIIGIKALTIMVRGYPPAGMDAGGDALE